MLLGIILHVLLSFLPNPIWPVQDVNQSEIYGIPLMLIHGFRMSLFFFVSGFFTMMIWQKHGTIVLVNNRFKRIVLPFVLCLAVFLPLQNKMREINEWWNQGKKELPQDQSIGASNSSEIQKKEAKNIWQASRTGNLEKVRSFLKSGINPNQRDRKQISPLHWAAGTGQVEVMNTLIQAGALVNAIDRYRSTPLHFAAFLGQPDSVRVLLKNGADPNLKNMEGSIPVMGAYADRKTTKWIAGDILELTIKFDSVKKGRKKVIQILGGVDPGNEVNSFFEAYLLNGKFITHHFWFLYDLIYLIVGFLLLAEMLKILPLPGVIYWLAKSRFRLLWLIPITYWAQFSMGANFGPDTTVTLEPDWVKLGYYAIFFGYGAICFGNSDFINKVGQFWPVYFALAIPTFCIGLFLMDDKSIEYNKEIASLAGSTYSWFMIFGMIGLFRKLFSKDNPLVRYISDSAYWVYLAHLSIIQLLQIWVSNWNLPNLIKILFVSLVATSLLLLSYRYLIRYTWIGTALNGKRNRTNISIN